MNPGLFHGLLASISSLTGFSRFRRGLPSQHASEGLRRSLGHPSANATRFTPPPKAASRLPKRRMSRPWKWYHSTMKSIANRKALEGV